MFVPFPDRPFRGLGEILERFFGSIMSLCISLMLLNLAICSPHLELLSCSFDLSLLWLGYSRLPTLRYKLNSRLIELAHFNLFDPLF